MWKDYSLCVRYVIKLITNVLFLMYGTFICYRQQFKAHPVNEKIFDKKQLGVKKAPARPLTQPVTPQLELRRRAANWRDRSDHEESYEFHANPVPKAILDGPTVSVLGGPVPKAILDGPTVSVLGCHFG